MQIVLVRFGGSLCLMFALLGCNFDTSGGTSASGLASASASGSSTTAGETGGSMVTSAGSSGPSTTLPPPNDDSGPTTTPGSTTDSGSGSDTTDDTGSSDSGPPPPPPPSCDRGGFCLPPAPVGWVGPAAIGTILSDRATLTCPDGFTEDVRAHRGVVADPAVCDCNCDGEQGTCTVGYTYYSNGGCNQGAMAGSVDDTCTPITVTEGGRVIADAPVASGGGCMPNASPPSLSTPGWAREVLLCGQNAGGGCESEFGEGSCYGDAGADFDGAFCIHQPGRHDCPDDGLFTGRTLIFDGFDDTRDCETCECGAPTGFGDCPGSMTQYSDATCTSEFSVLDTGICSDAPSGSSFSARYVGDLPNAECDPPTVGPTGDVVGTNPTTVCCSGANL